MRRTSERSLGTLKNHAFSSPSPNKMSLASPVTSPFSYSSILSHLFLFRRDILTTVSYRVQATLRRESLSVQDYGMAIWGPSVCCKQKLATFRWWRYNLRHSTIMMDPQRCFRSSGMWRHVVWWIIINVSGTPAASMFRVVLPFPPKHWYISTYVVLHYRASCLLMCLDMSFNRT
jgi:hypothetical protein